MRNEQISLQKTKISGHRMVKIKVLGSLRLIECLEDTSHTWLDMLSIHFA